jgi:hypothetical protein
LLSNGVLRETVDLLGSRLQGLSAHAVNRQFVTILGLDAIAYSTVTNYLRQRQFPSVLCGVIVEEPSLKTMPKISESSKITRNQIRTAGRMK